jgi:flavin reductase (DIM6/NTAB) family NADH-FMN oxidoreductase RutF
MPCRAAQNRRYVAAMNEAARPEVDPALFRRVMGRFATGVTVITAEHDGEARGMTANAFMSGSLEPPLCVVSIAKRAHMHHVMLAARHFGVNILADDQVELSEHFAGRRNPRLDVRFERVGPAMLLESACARIAAETAARHDCGDHTIFIGHILKLDASSRAPLLYHAGRYRSLDGARIDANVGVPEFW